MSKCNVCHNVPLNWVNVIKGLEKSFLFICKCQTCNSQNSDYICISINLKFLGKILTYLKIFFIN